MWVGRTTMNGEKKKGDGLKWKKKNEIYILYM